METLLNLEAKVNRLIEELKNLRSQNAELREKDKQNQEKITILEKENEGLKNQMSGLSSRSEEDRKKIDLASEKIKDILGKLDECLGQS